MDLSGTGKPLGGIKPGDTDAPSLRRRMVNARWLLILAGILGLLGFVLVALGVAGGISILGVAPGLSVAFANPLVPWGIFLVGVGFIVGCVGAAVKGPSVEWRDIAPEAAPPAAESPRPVGMRYACPGCGGDVYTSQRVCPECGQKLLAAPAAGP